MPLDGYVLAVPVANGNAASGVPVPYGKDVAVAPVPKGYLLAEPIKGLSLVVAPNASAEEDCGDSRAAPVVTVT